MSIVNLTMENFQREVLNSDKPVLVDFWASWCGPCRMVAPLVEQIATENADVKVGKVDIDAQPELANAFRVAGRRVPRVGVVIGGLVIVAGAAFWGAEGALIGLFAGSLLLTLWRLVEGLVPAWETPRKTLIRDVFSGLFTLVYVAFLGSFAVLLVQAPRGEWWAFALVLVVVSVDVGAYAAGVTLGKHKMTPRISPNKTWEGFAGAAVTAVTSGIVISILALHQPWWVGIVLGLVVLLTATGGDLTESLIKRNLGVKDMSSWIPGHGGFLDRLDSLLPSAVGVYGIALALGVL